MHLTEEDLLNKYISFNKPIPYKSFLIYPIKLKDTYDVQEILNLLQVDKNILGNIELITMSNLRFILMTAYVEDKYRVQLDYLLRVALNINDTQENIKKIILTERYSRIPVYKDNIDNIIGILHTRDYLEQLLQVEFPDLNKLIQPAHFIYRSKKLSSLLSDFKHRRLHIAIVTDDYGGTLGIVTMEDLLEQIVGDIWDEDEEIENKYKKIDDDKFEIIGDMNITDMLDLISKDSKYIVTDSKTVGGWVIEQIGNIPNKNDRFIYKDMTIIIDDIEDKRVNKITISLNDEKNSVILST